MPHIEYTEVFYQAATSEAHRFVVPADLSERVETLLRRASKTSMRKRDSIPAEEAFPDAFDPVKGPAIYLRGLRYRENMTQKQLAQKLGIRQHHLSEMETAKRPISKEMAKKLAAILRTDWKGFL
jgi:DNA-binding XRE family transcriptional regulator